jgi:hypothetical protein
MKPIATSVVAAIVAPIVAAVLGAAAFHHHVRAAFAAAQGNKDEPAAKKPAGKFTISKETTYVTGPLDKDGYIDYAAALNERLGQGVTPENNANVLLWRAMGLQPDVKMSAEFFRLMGMNPPPAGDDYFLDLRRYLKEELKIDVEASAEAINEEESSSMRMPWTANELPHIESWLAANVRPLGLAVEATRRTHYFVPIVARKKQNGEFQLLFGNLPATGQQRYIAQALVARAMLRIAHGANDDAWQDILACHRLGRLVGRGPSLIDALAGSAIDRIACTADIVFLDKAKPSALRIEGCMLDLRKLPPLPQLADKLDLGERFSFLDSVSGLDRLVTDEIKSVIQEASKDPSFPAAAKLAAIDFEPALRSGNRWYNRLVAAAREPDRATQQKLFDQLNKEIAALRPNLPPQTRFEFVQEEIKKVSNAKSAKELNDGVRELNKIIGEELGSYLIQLFLPALDKVQRSTDTSRQSFNNVLAAFALAWYHAENGKYPADLKALAPKYLPQVPQDLFSAKPLVYRPAANGYLLYSIGANGKDDGGRGPDDVPPGDDLSVRMPLPPLPPPPAPPARGR